jgi:hypothetical protein
MKDYVPLLQTLAWVLLIAVVLVAFRREFRNFAESIRHRVDSGSPFELGVGQVASVKLGELQQLRRVEPTEPGRQLPDPTAEAAVEHWSRMRDEIKNQSREVYLAHIIKPSAIPGQRYDVYVFLLGSKDADLSKVERAQFFLGRHWGNRIFDVPNQGGSIGLSTSAYGPVLCLCRIRFQDGHEAMVSRYLDFEMGPFLSAPSSAT